MCSLQFPPEGLEDARALPRHTKNALKKELLRTLARNPRASTKELTGPLAGWRSLGWRNYRIVFKVFEDLQVVAIAGISERLPQSRADIYRRLESLAADGRLAEKLLRVLRGFT